MLTDLTHAIATDFPRHLDPDAFQLEEYAQRSFAESKARTYVPDEQAAYYKQLDDFVDANASNVAAAASALQRSCLLISGAPGSGMSLHTYLCLTLICLCRLF